MRNAAAKLLVIASIGFGTGVLTLVGQGILDAGWNRLANSGAIWLMVGFLVGSLMPSAAWAAVAGGGTLLGAIAGYYVAAIVIANASASPSSLVIWSAAAVVGGPVYGLSGRLWREPSPAPRMIAVGLFGGILCAEGVSTILRIPELVPVGLVEVIAGVAATLVIGRSWRDRVGGLGLVPIVIIAGVAAYQIIDWLFAAV